MSTIDKQWLQQKIAGMEATRDEIPFGLDEDDSNTLAALRIALASLEAEPVPEWTNEQCLEFLSIAFRHAEINGDLQLDDIRLGVKMVNGSRTAMLQGVDGNSPAGWVACSERMPKFGDYLVTDGKDIDVQMFNGEQFIPGFVWEDNITHWMPLPAAPQQKV